MLFKDIYLKDSLTVTNNILNYLYGYQLNIKSIEFD